MRDPDDDDGSPSCFCGRCRGSGRMLGRRSAYLRETAVARLAGHFLTLFCHMKPGGDKETCPAFSARRAASGPRGCFREDLIESHRLVCGIRGSACRARRLFQFQGPFNKDDSEFTYLLDRSRSGPRTRWRICRRCRTRGTCCRSTFPRNATRFRDGQEIGFRRQGRRGALHGGRDEPGGRAQCQLRRHPLRNYEWRLYASIDDDQNAWDRTGANDFRRIENGELNAYHAALYQDYFCANKLPTGTAKQI